MPHKNFGKKMRTKFNDAKFYTIKIIKKEHLGYRLKLLNGFSFFCDDTFVKEVRGGFAYVRGKDLNFCGERQLHNFDMYQRKLKEKRGSRKGKKTIDKLIKRKSGASNNDFSTSTSPESFIKKRDRAVDALKNFK